MSAPHHNALHSTGIIGSRRSRDNAIWQPSGPAFGDASFLSGRQHGSQHTSLAINLRRTAADLVNLAPELDAIVTGLSETHEVVVPALIQDLQNARSDIAYLTKLVHEQRYIIEGRDQEIRILSQKLSSSQTLVADQTNGNPAASPSTATSRTSSKEDCKAGL
ncbi:hypothetical protein N7471_013416 [Penicillium samsonianum]|uniref:uncharacterized protein n=1 Tax=Penicillium samsonianum TaxID=1882272 RepID=UPI002549057A|nr:uncharacterized protein N7471_013416 [Penicillium samsonianum]KAJ6118796.1 hypothetical protein N7471_013416 [Penicillium samsonianum]